MKTICYCWGYTDDDVIRDVIANKGISTIESKIAGEKAAGNCRCATKNPTKT